jgi:hypothetical protein
MRFRLQNLAALLFTGFLLSLGASGSNPTGCQAISLMTFLMQKQKQGAITMLNIKRDSSLTTLIVVLAGMIFAPYAFADDEDDVLAVIHQYGDLEGDLDSQAEMMRDDRVHIVGGQRRSDQALNLQLQKASRAASEAVNGGKTRIITSIESPQVAIYGNVAVASFVQTYNFFPHNQPASAGQPTWVTLVLVKERGQWGIAHAHGSPAGGN